MVFGLALGLGILADLLLRETPWGLNAALWSICFAGAVVALVHLSGVKPPAGWEVIMAVVVLCSTAIAWRDAPMLVVVDFLAAAAGGLLIVMHSGAVDLRRIHIVEVIIGTISSAIDALLGAAALIFSEIKTDLSAGPGRSKRGVEIIRGGVLAVPLVIIFGSLFVAADATFEHIVLEILNIDFAELLGHILIIACVGWPLAGVFRQRFLGGDRPWSMSLPSRRFSLGLTEVGIILGSVVFLSFAFVVTQFVYLFGGSEYILGSSALTVAEYARRGFFELVAVAGLTLPLLLLGEWVLRKDNPARVRGFRILAGIQLLLLFIIMSSALHRLYLYQVEFGLTQLRVYASTVLFWLSIVFVWFLFTVLRGRRDRFASGAYLCGVALLLLLHAVNPDDLIVRTNVARYEEGKELDARYINTLSADAVPRLVSSLPRLPEPERGTIAGRLLQMRTRWEEVGWGSWNYSRSQALSMINQNLSLLLSLREQER
jgi:hypothetical protein